MIKFGIRIKNQAGRMTVFFLLFCLLSLIVPGYLLAAPDSRTEVVVYYFYVNVCESCREAEDTIQYYVDRLRHSDYRLRFFNYNIEKQEGLERLYQLCEIYQVPIESRSVPILFVGDRYYHGDKEISRGLDEIKDNLDQGIVPKSLFVEENSRGDDLVRSSFSSLKLINVFVVGLINGLNPCSLSMLLLFLSALITRPEISIIKVGLAFMFGKFIAYLLLGTLLYEMLGTLELAAYKTALKISVGIFVGLVSYLNIRDYFAAKREAYGEIKNQLPPSLRKWNHNVIARFSMVNSQLGLILVAGILGAIISIGEFLCTGQVYLATIIYVLQSDTGPSWRAFSLFFLYSVAFIIPATLLLLIIARTGKLMYISELLRRKLALIKLLTALVLIIAGLAIIAFT